MSKDYFTRSDGSDELACSCGCGLTIRPGTRSRLNQLRKMFDRPIPAWGARCEKNKWFSSPASSHGNRMNSAGVMPCAVDINIASRSDRMELVAYAILAGFTGIGLGDTKLHIDDDESKQQPGETIRYWLYK